MVKGLKICHIAAECTTYIKCGGLADVIHSLPFFQGNDHDVHVLLPFYTHIQIESDSIHTTIINASEKIEYTVYSRVLKNLTHHYIHISSHHFFDRGSVYGFSDDTTRFALFSVCAAHFCSHTIHPDLIHAHDWHTGIIPILTKGHTHSIFTIHNLAYQGISTLPPLITNLLPEHIDSNDVINQMSLGIEHASYITTVSPSYAHEIQNNGHSCGLDTVINMRKDSLIGILNGIDTSYWAPETDRAITNQYNIKSFIEGKNKNKSLSLHMKKLSSNMLCTFTSITRLVYQKSPELIIHAMHWCIENQCNFVLICSETPQEFKKEIDDLSKDPHIFVMDTFDDTLARQSYAASDYILIPSRYEPCGLTQMIGMRYGCIPIARNVGGLKDSIQHMVNGIHIFEHSKKSLIESLEIAHKIWKENKEQFQTIARNGMLAHLGWQESALEYTNLYNKALRDESFSNNISVSEDII